MTEPTPPNDDHDDIESHAGAPVPDPWDEVPAVDDQMTPGAPYAEPSVENWGGDDDGELDKGDGAP